MLLSELLNELNDIAVKNNISPPFVVGGLPRDKVFGFASNVKDIDITTGDKGSFELAILSSKTWTDASFRSYDDGHSSLDFKNIRLDFSNNFILPGIEDELIKLGIEEPTLLQKEMFSRDFTVNTLLQPVDLKQEPFDITGLGISDIKEKKLRTPVNPEFTIGYDPRRILRAIKLSIKYDLEILDDVKEAMLKYRGAVGELPVGHIKKQVNQMLRMDTEKTINLLMEFKLLPIIPISKLMVLEATKNRMIQSVLDNMRF
jgi:poly(A) polymerase